VFVVYLYYSCTGTSCTSRILGLVKRDQVELTHNAHGFVIVIFTNLYYNEIVYLSLTSD